jgi:hypothetical protein
MQVEPKVYELLELFRKEGLDAAGKPYKKQKTDNLFDQVRTSIVVYSFLCLSLFFLFRN